MGGCAKSYPGKAYRLTFMKSMIMKRIKSSIAIFSALFFISCSGTKLVSSWRAEDAVTKEYHNIMVWGILTEKDSALRREMETHLMNDLISKGYHAISSMEVYGNRAFKKFTEKEIVDEFKNTGVDAVATIVLLSMEKEEIYVPARIVERPANSYDQFDKYYSSVFDKIYTPGYYTSTTKYFWESNFFEVGADKHIYSVRTRSFDPSSASGQAHENGLKIIEDMQKKKVIVDLNNNKQQRKN